MSRSSLLTGVRVLDLSGRLGGLYTGRLLADAGAEVLRPASATADLGDPGTGRSRAAYEALERLLNAGKRDVSDVPSELERVDVVIDTSDWPGFDARSVRELLPHLVVVSLTGYGLTGPHAQHNSCSALLQAQSGSASSRGLPEWPPLIAAGETEQFLAGVYGAAAALAAVHAGQGDLIDLSLLEVSNFGQTIFGTTQASMRRRLGEDFPRRSMQIPANEQTSDGWVGLCTISARQRQDLLLIVGREDLADDESAAYGNDNPAMDAEIRASVAEWTRSQTTEEVVALASALRIPVSPLVTGATVAHNEQLQARGFYRQDADGTQVPEPPFRFSPSDGEPREDGESAAEADSGALAGVRVVDLTAWWAGTCATQIFAAMGADVVKVEAANHPDGMRYSFVADPLSDQWWERGPVFYALNTNKRGITLDLTTDRGCEVLADLLADADLLVENFSPRVLDSLAIDWNAVRRRNPRLITVRMPAFGLDGPWRDRTGFAQTIEQSSGLAWITGYPDGPPVAPRGICDPLAGVHGAFAGLAALHRQRRTGLGGEVEVSMLEPAAFAATGQSLAWQLDGVRVDRIGNRSHRHAPQGVYPTAEDDEWVCVAVTSSREWAALADAMDRPDLTQEQWLDTAFRIEHADAIDAVVSGWTAQRSAAATVDELRVRNVPVARVDGGGKLLDHPQLAHRGYFEFVDHPVAGRHPVPGLPFRSERHRDRWHRSPAPLLGQHTAEVLSDWLGMTSAEIADLVDQGVSGTRPSNLGGEPDSVEP